MAVTFRKAPTLEDNNRLIALPEYLTAPDGRKFRITFWQPTVTIDDLVRVSIEALVSLPPAEASTN